MSRLSACVHDNIPHCPQCEHDVSPLEQWALDQEGDATVSLTLSRGDGLAWVLSLSRPSSASDPEQLPPDDLSYYDEEGRRVWDFEGETPYLARRAAVDYVTKGTP